MMPGATSLQDHKDMPIQSLPPSTDIQDPSSPGVGMEGSSVGRWKECGGESHSIGTLGTDCLRKKMKEMGGPWTGAGLGTSSP